MILMIIKSLATYSGFWRRGGLVQLMEVPITRVIFIEKSLKFPILLAPKLLALLHWFQNCFCFCSTTFPFPVGACGQGDRTKI